MASENGSSVIRSLCLRCGKTWPVDALACSCGTEFREEVATVIDDVHAMETQLLNPSRSRQTDADMTTEEYPSPAPQQGSSSDPPTRVLRGFDLYVGLPRGAVIDDYEIEERIGAGSMGEVYSARHVRLQRRVAIKVIASAMSADPQALARFEREARTLASLHHPNIVDVYGFGTLTDGRSYFVMEHLVGETLAERLMQRRLAFGEALDVVDQMARGLEAAHAQGIVHRDLKPSNVLIMSGDQGPLVKLLDFGLSKGAVSDGVERTGSGVVIGTARYLSPEQARSPHVDGRSDVYALGCVAYELLLGRHPFPEARTPIAAIAAHLTEPVPPPRTIWPQIPVALDLLLFSMLAKDPRYRPSLAQVRGVIADLRAPAEPPRQRAATEPVQIPARYVRVESVALLMLALLAGILIGAFMI